MCADTPDLPLVLIIDDRTDLLRFCERQIGEEYRFVHVTSARGAAQHMSASSQPVAVLLDRDFSKSDPSELLGPAEDARNEGLAILRQLRSQHARLPVLMVTGYREQRLALEAADLGADFLAWQDVIEDPGILRARLKRALEQGEGHEEAVLARFRQLGIVAESPAFRQTLVSLHQALPGKAPILLLGETGTGKDSLAYAAHALSGDSARPFVNVNMAALNPGLIESELFGHVRGAFTGADRDRIGKIRYANGGTLFMNEVGELAGEIQAKLLAVIETHEVSPVGDVSSMPVDFRLITATSRNPAGLVQSGVIRPDLFHRLAWHSIEIPPLRKRREDIPALVRAFLRSSGQGNPGGIAGIAREAIEYLGELPWQGNVRELKAVVEAASAGVSYVITLKDVRDIVRRRDQIHWGPESALDQAVVSTTAAASLLGAPNLLGEEEEGKIFANCTYRELTARYFAYLMKRTEGRLLEVARLAGIGRATAYEWRDRFSAGGDSHGRPA